jgi:hypothetical protein
MEPDECLIINNKLYNKMHGLCFGYWCTKLIWLKNGTIIINSKNVFAFVILKATGIDRAF